MEKYTMFMDWKNQYGGLGLIPGQGIEILHAPWLSQERKKEGKKERKKGKEKALNHGLY